MTTTSGWFCGSGRRVRRGSAVDERQEHRQPESPDERPDPPTVPSLSASPVFFAREPIISRQTVKRTVHRLSLPSWEPLTRPWSLGSKERKSKSIGLEHRYGSPSMTAAPAARHTSMAKVCCQILPRQGAASARPVRISGRLTSSTSSRVLSHEPTTAAEVQCDGHLMSC